MNSILETNPSNARAPKALWATVGVLAVAVAALGGTMLYQHASAPAGTAMPLAASQPLQGPDDFKAGEVPPALASQGPGGQAVAQAPAPANTARTPIQAPANALPAAPAVATAPAPAPRAVCAVCGRVESVHAVQTAAPATGVGAVAGGVLGGVLGNQIGHGGGRAAATVIGAVGGGYLGNTVEQRTRTKTTYQVHVRMDNGTLRTVTTATAPPIGKSVTLEGGVLRPADGQV
ncbi:glycine zipper 2TM domain-containing protein [Variovorax ginsengisoli]|uniref:Outer membrane lipoprotein SlyB n=1 Tax=Variovorax ginsengisoli TaxID=363844 RepID=A0ABT9S706_9BURK|nr:glycine zipper 2TM domain-containing protein [Variovorax ginsengisoli]MDP9899551.1 outer membrane lipoprotein SlyB [Variovorax ginsengisoli]